MDTPTAPPFINEPKSALTDQQKRGLIIAGIAVVLLAVAYGAYRYWDGNRIIPKGHSLVIAADSLPLAPLQSVNLKDGTLTPVSIEGQGTAVLLDTAESETHNYYLIGDPNFERVNLYRQDKANPGAGLAELTHSQTSKFDLSYDALSDSAAYVSVSNSGDLEITVWRNAGGEEKRLGVGRHPVLLSGGFFVVFERGGTLVSANVESGEMHNLLALPQDAVFAVDADSMKAAIYNPTSKSLEEYSLAGMTGASYLSSTPTGAAPRELAYTDEKLVRIEEGEGGGVIASGNSSIKLPASIFEALLENRKISTYHD